MHHRNPYKNPPSFIGLADTYPPLKPHVIQTSDSHGTIYGTIDFKDEASQRCLTEALLHRDFGIKLHLPSDRLCPPVPNRLNYILWIQDIVNATSSHTTGRIRGIDIGTGASAIYPLLASKLEDKWEFVATEIDETSLAHAQSNIAMNGLDFRIAILQATPDGPILLPLDKDTSAMFDFSMCNPPFYGSQDEVSQSADAKEYEPHAVCTGADVEMITPGGESNFVSRIVRESVDFGIRCKWYTSMLGKMSSLTDVVILLRQLSIENYAITEFVQGRTRRWAIAWSFTDTHLPDSIARISNQALQPIMPRRNTLHQTFRLSRTPDLIDVLCGCLNSINDVSISPSQENPSIFIICAARDTWSRSARRKKVAFATPPSAPVLSSTSALVCSVRWNDTGSLQRETKDANDTGPSMYQISLESQWIEGKDRSLYESFSSHVGRKVKATLVEYEGRLSIK